jgi:uncharacterized protein (TIGR02266 family)
MPDDGRTGRAPLGAGPSRRRAPQASERRDRVRCEVHVDIDVQSGERLHAGVTRDLSEAGAFVVTELELEAGTCVDIAVHLPGRAEPLCCTGEVRWRRAPGSGSSEPAGVGLRFVALESEVRRALQAYLLECAPLDVDD